VTIFAAGLGHVPEAMGRKPVQHCSIDFFQLINFI
jgi:hypothetical protein